MSVFRWVLLLAGVAVAGETCLLAPLASGLVAQQSIASSTPSWESTPLLDMTQLDSTTPPCHDFYQFATGGWYRQHPTAIADSVEVVGPDLRRVGAALQEYVVATAVARNATDPTTRLVGDFFVSCLEDTTGAVAGLARATARADACFRLTRDSLDWGLATLVLERFWPPEARALSRTMWTGMTEAAAARIRASKALHDSTKQRMLEVVTTTQLMVDNDPLIPFLTLLDQDAPAWSQAAGRAAALTLSPHDFRGNLARLRGAADSVFTPELRQTLRYLLDDLINGSGAYYTNTGSPSVIAMAARSLVPPRVGGRIDLGGWYGSTGAALLGHEITHPLDFLASDPGYASEMRQFAEEQWRGQLEIRANTHFFDDFFGALIAYDALEQVLRQQPHEPIDGFTAAQRFFIGAAQSVLGGGLTTESISASHSATRWRVYANGSLSAMPGFAEAFSCQANDPMAGGHVWYRAPWQGIVLTPAQQVARYREYYADHYGEVTRIFFSDEDERNVGLTEAQRQQISSITAAHGPQRDALVDSLQSVTDNGAGNQRILRLIASQLAEVRARLDLTPDQAARFDERTRLWMQQYLPGD